MYHISKHYFLLVDVDRLFNDWILRHFLQKVTIVNFILLKRYGRNRNLMLMRQDIQTLDNEIRVRRQEYLKPCFCKHYKNLHKSAYQCRMKICLCFIYDNH